MKKSVIIFLVCLFLVAGGIVFYLVSGKANVKNKTNELLVSKGYTEKDISSISIKHSFVSALLSYGEWHIRVKFVTEPNVEYLLKYNNNEVSLEMAQAITMDKDELETLELRFENGDLKVK